MLPSDDDGFEGEAESVTPVPRARLMVFVGIAAVLLTVGYIAHFLGFIG